MVLTTLEEIKTYSDPYRLQILNVFNILDRPATVKEVSDKMGEVPAKVHYHVKKLEKVGLLNLVSTKEVNGIVAKYYEPFMGTIEIKRKEQMNEPSADEMMRSETYKLLSELYEQNKQRFFKQAKDSPNPKASITNSTLRITDEEARSLFEQINQLIEPYRDQKSEGERRSYELFLTMIRNDAE